MLGVDFRMDHSDAYSFKQTKGEGGSESNNQGFAVVNRWMNELVQKQVFSSYGLELYNCYELSGLTAFGHVPVDEALKDVVGIVEDVPDLDHWYEKQNCPKCESWKIRHTYNDCECTDCSFTWDVNNRPKA